MDLVRNYGGPISHIALDPSRNIFRCPAINGLVCFFLVHRCAVVYGDPICSIEDKPQLADAFAVYCEDNRWTILYVAATANLQTCMVTRGYASIEFADLLINDLGTDPEMGAQARHLRQHINRARRKGVSVREYLGETDMQMETQTMAAFEAWLENRHGLQMYLGLPRLFKDKKGRRWFIAEQAGQVIGFLSMLRADCSGNQRLINIVFSSPDSPLYTNELMVVTALRILREECAESVCLGVGPMAKLGRIQGFSAIAEFFSRMIYRLAGVLMHPHDKTVFWEKFGVTQREPLYLLFQSSRLRISELYALLRAFNFSLTR